MAFPVIRAVLRSCDSGQEGQEGGASTWPPPFLLANCPDLPATTWVARIMTYRTGAGSPGMGSNSAGMLMSGTTYSVVPSELLQAAGHVGMFTG